MEGEGERVREESRTDRKNEREKSRTNRKNEREGEREKSRTDSMREIYEREK
jgi:hypothetical protein